MNSRRSDLPRSTNRSHNYELFEFAKIMSLKSINTEELQRAQRGISATIRVVSAAGYEDHATIALATSNHFVIVRYVGAGGTPIIRNFNWNKLDKFRIVDMCWCPLAQHLLILTTDMTIFLLPAINLILGTPPVNTSKNVTNQPQRSFTKKTVEKADPNAPVGSVSHLTPENEMKIYNNTSKAMKYQDSGNIFWWRTSDLYDYAITVSDRGSIRFTNLHTQEVKRNSLNLNIRVQNANFINDQDSYKYLLLQEQNGDIKTVVIEQKSSNGTTRNIFELLERNQGIISQPFNKKSSDKRQAKVSIRDTNRGTLVGLYLPFNNKLEVHSADLRSYPLYVYQLFSAITFAHITEKLTFAVSYIDEEKCSRVYVISNWIASTSEGQREAIMQEFSFHNQKILGCFPAFRSKDPNSPTSTNLEGFFVWTRNGVYECRPKLPPETIFFRLLAQGLDRTDAEPLGNTVGLDILHLYEIAADKYFEEGKDGRALDLYFLSNVQVYKLVYKFLEIGRMDVVLVHLNSLVLTQAESLSTRARSKLSDLLLYCYIYRIANAETENEFSESRSDLVQEFHKFLENCDSYDHQKAVKKLLQLGMIEDMFKVWQTSGCRIVPCIKVLTDGEYIDLCGPIVESLVPLVKTNEEFVAKQQVLFRSSFFRSLPIDSQIKLILEDNSFIKRNINIITASVPLLREETLIELVSVFDPFGQQFQSIGFDTDENANLSQSSIPNLNEIEREIDQNLLSNSTSAIELFLQVLLFLCYLLHKKESKPALSSNIRGSKEISSSGEETDHLSSSTPRSLRASFLQENMEARRVRKVCCGSNHIAVITETGELYTWGANRSGQLGLGDISISNVSTPTRVTALQGNHIKRVSCGGEFTLVRTNKLQVFSWGKGTSGQLGHGNMESLASPKLINSLDGLDVVHISCGFHHSAVLTEYGCLWMFGKGLLGNGVETTSAIPIMIDDIDGEEVACGWAHTVVRTSQGEVYTWGAGEYGQLGHGDNKEVTKPKLVESLHNKNIKKIGCGYFHTLAITDLRNLYSWGRGSHGKLGHGNEENQNSPQLVNEFLLKRIVDVEAGYWQSAALTDKGEVYIWGSNANGLLGLGDSPVNDSNSLVPTIIPKFSGTKVTQISCADGHSAAITEDQELYVWGTRVADSESFADTPELVDVRERVRFRVLGDSQHETDDGLDSVLSLEHYQHLLNDTLQEKFSCYDPTLLLQQSIDYENWEATKIIYRNLRDYSAEIRCTLRSLRNNIPFDKPSAIRTILFRHGEIIEEEKVSADESAYMLLILVDFWYQCELDASELESHVLRYIPQLTEGIQTIMNMERIPRLPFSPKVFLSVTRYCLEQFNTKKASNSNLVSEDAIWSQIQKNIEHENEQTDQIFVNKDSKRLQGMTQNELKSRIDQKDAVVFSCGHIFNIKEFEKKQNDFFYKTNKSSASHSCKLIWEDYSQRLISHACPDCAYLCLDTQFQINQNRRSSMPRL